MSEETAQYSVQDFVSRIHSNLESDIITLTEDKAKICLTDFEKNRENNSAWITPLGMLIAIGSMILTADFKELILEPQYWFAIFFVSGIVCLLWLIISILKIKKSMSVDDIIAKMKNISTNGLNSE